MPLKKPPRFFNAFKAACFLSLLASGLALGWQRSAAINWPLNRLDDVLYDALYRRRPPLGMQNSDVVIVVVDDESLKVFDEVKHFGWPWPRTFWAAIIPYLQSCGARAIAFDLLYNQRSVLASEFDDDNELARAIDSATLPVIFATLPDAHGKADQFAPAAFMKTQPAFGAVHIDSPRDDVVYRSYQPAVNGMPSLALRAAQASGLGTVDPAQISEPFLLHFYGPHQLPDGSRTFKYIHASSVIGAAIEAQTPSTRPSTIQLNPADFKNKIVLIGAIAAGTYDLKSMPLSAEYPGVELHATAIENLLRHQRVQQLSWPIVAGFTLALSFIAALGTVLPRRVGTKLSAVAPAIMLWGIAGSGLFAEPVIRWLPLAAPLLGIMGAIVGGLAWSFLGEDRQRRRLLKALSSVVSPHIAQELATDPSKLAVGARRQMMTAMFTDVAGFTDLSESLDVEKLSHLLNHYLEEMSGVILKTDGTLDKYVGDAIVSFWNAPLPQPDHALRACRAALGIQQREREIQAELFQMAHLPIFTRIGVHTGPMAVGFTGSTRLLNYTVLGDAVNLASRLEGANKLYGSQVLISHDTAEQVRDHFAMRQLDLLRVKGRQQPLAVYELLAECPPYHTPPPLQQLIAQYQTALKAYQQQQWAAARQTLLELLQTFKDDAPSAALLQRIDAYQQDPPPPDWDGVYTAKQK